MLKIFIVQLQVWLNDVKKVYPGQFQEPLVLKYVNIPDIYSENIDHMIPLKRSRQISTTEEDPDWKNL